MLSMWLLLPYPFAYEPQWQRRCDKRGVTEDGAIPMRQHLQQVQGCSRLGLSPERGKALWRVPAAPSFLLSHPRLDTGGVHVILVIHTNSLPPKRCPGDPGVILTRCLDKGWLVFAHKTSTTAPLWCITNHSFNVIEEIKLDKHFPRKQIILSSQGCLGLGFLWSELPLLFRDASEY